MLRKTYLYLHVIFQFKHARIETVYFLSRKGFNRSLKDFEH